MYVYVVESNQWYEVQRRSGNACCDELFGDFAVVVAASISFVDENLPGIDLLILCWQSLRGWCMPWELWNRL